MGQIIRLLLTLIINIRKFIVWIWAIGIMLMSWILFFKLIVLVDSINDDVISALLGVLRLS